MKFVNWFFSGDSDHSVNFLQFNQMINTRSNEWWVLMLITNKD